MNYEGVLLTVKVTAGNADDRNPVFDIVENATGSLYAMLTKVVYLQGKKRSLLSRILIV